MKIERIPVLNPDGTPAMPTKPSRARKWVKQGKAVSKWNDAGVNYVQLINEPCGYEKQDIVIGIDPGKSFTGVAVQSKQATLYIAHLVLPFERIKKRLGAAIIKKGKVVQKICGRALQRRVRRGRRIDRSLPFKLRAHRQKRFNNRKQFLLSPSIKASRLMEIRVVKELVKIFPITNIVYEIVKADVDITSGRKSARSGKGFSPVMIGQNWACEQLSVIAPVKRVQGWQKDGNGTSQIRKYLGLEKIRDKKAQTPQSHAVDGVALASSLFIRRGVKPGNGVDVVDWFGTVNVTSSVFQVITRPAYFRRALHFDNPSKGGARKRKGGTLSPYGFRYGDKVIATKKGQSFIGWVGGYTNSAKSKLVSVYDHNWKRIGQFSFNKVQLIRRSNKLCVI